jgi:hypothetical protein
MRLNSGRCAKTYCCTLATSLTTQGAALPCRRNTSTSDRRERPTRNEHQCRKFKHPEREVRKRCESRSEPAKCHEFYHVRSRPRVKFFPNEQAKHPALSALTNIPQVSHVASDQHLQHGAHQLVSWRYQHNQGNHGPKRGPGQSSQGRFIDWHWFHLLHNQEAATQVN